MRRRLKWSTAALALALALSGGSRLPFADPPPALAVQPDEVLADPELEARARRISAGLRCLVCQNQSIDDSNAEMARDLRLLVRERLEAGDADEEIIDYLVSRYGEFVLLQPRVNWGNAALWAAPLLVLVAGGLFALVSLRRRPAPAQGLSPAEEEALRAVLDRNRR